MASGAIRVLGIERQLIGATQDGTPIGWWAWLLFGHFDGVSSKGRLLMVTGAGALVLPAVAHGTDSVEDTDRVAPLWVAAGSDLGGEVDHLIDRPVVHKDFETDVLDDLETFELWCEWSAEQHEDVAQVNPGLTVVYEKACLAVANALEWQ